MKTNPHLAGHARSGFTLIELMAVITIIVILAGLVVGGMGFVSERQAKEKAKVQIALLSKALEEYKLDMGTYPLLSSNTPAAPTAPNGTGTSSRLYNALFYDGFEFRKNPSRPVSTPAKAEKIYLSDLDPTASKQGWVVTRTTGDPQINQIVTDPWGNQYCYRAAVKVDGSADPNTQNPDFDLWSMGKDGKTNADPKHKDCRDDIRNF